MKKYTLVTFILNGEPITRYFEGKPTLEQIQGMIGVLFITETKTVKDNFQADYVKAKNLYEYTAA